jgi:hypothetical protein
MKSLLTSLLFCCIATLSFAQSKLEIKVFGSPTFSYRIMTGDKEVRKLLKDVHDPIFFYEGGILITIKNRARMDFETGLVFSRKGLSFGEISFRDENNDPMGTMEISMSANFLELPFRMNYFTSEAKRNYLVAGLSADFLIKAKYHYKFEGDSSDGIGGEQPMGMRKVNVGLQVGYGCRLVNSEGFGLDLEPNFKIQLLDSNTETTLTNTHFYTIGLACKFRFKV